MDLYGECFRIGLVFWNLLEGFQFIRYLMGFTLYGSISQ